jgi:hypothetical protein
MTQERDTAKVIVEYLEYGTTGLDAETAAKLAAARNKAVAAIPASASVSQGVLAHDGLGSFVSQHLHGRQAWMSVLVTLAIILMAVALFHKNTTLEPVDADALLLASDLPPEAYVDKGFDTWLENSSQQ